MWDNLPQCVPYHTTGADQLSSPKFPGHYGHLPVVSGVSPGNHWGHPGAPLATLGAVSRLPHSPPTDTCTPLTPQAKLRHRLSTFCPDFGSWKRAACPGLVQPATQRTAQFGPRSPIGAQKHAQRPPGWRRERYGAFHLSNFCPDSGWTKVGQKLDTGQDQILTKPEQRPYSDPVFNPGGENGRETGSIRWT